MWNAQEAEVEDEVLAATDGDYAAASTDELPAEQLVVYADVEEEALGAGGQTGGGDDADEDLEAPLEEREANGADANDEEYQSDGYEDDDAAKAASVGGYRSAQTLGSASSLAEQQEVTAQLWATLADKLGQCEDDEDGTVRSPSGPAAADRTSGQHPAHASTAQHSASVGCCGLQLMRAAMAAQLSFRSSRDARRVACVAPQRALFDACRGSTQAAGEGDEQRASAEEVVAGLLPALGVGGGGSAIALPSLRR